MSYKYYEVFNINNIIYTLMSFNNSVYKYEIINNLKEKLCIGKYENLCNYKEMNKIYGFI